MRFPRVVAAARTAAEARFALAEALATEIPPTRRGPTPSGHQSIPDQLADAATEIQTETGERYEWRTLEQYRKVALWVSQGDLQNFPWANASYTAHEEAYNKGETFEQFVGSPDTKRRVRERNGGATGDVPAAARAINVNPAEAAKFVESLSPEGMEAVAEAALHREASAHGVEMQARRSVPDPEPNFHRLTRRIAVDLIMVVGEINGLRSAGDHALADRATTDLREVLANGIAQLEVIPDTIEGLA